MIKGTWDKITKKTPISLPKIGMFYTFLALPRNVVPSRQGNIEVAKPLFLL